ncbi:MAG: glycosyltransferase family 4 protein [Verrucomicrobiaceae bacterium]
MRITIICGGGHLSGKEIMALEIGQGLRVAGQDISYVNSLWGNGKFRDRLKALKFKTRSMRLGFISATLTWDCLRMTADQLVRVPGLWLDYRKFLQQEKPENIIHTNWHHLIVLWTFLEARRDWFWLHEVIPDTSQYRRVFGWLSNRLCGFITVSHAVKQSLLQIGIPGEKITVIHNGLADPALDAGAIPVDLSGQRLGIAGQIGGWKGHQDLLEAFALIAEKHPQAELHVFGTGDSGLVQEMKLRAVQLGLSSRLIWHGFVAERHEIYGKIDICVVPSRSADPLPTTAIEAAFFGLPVVATRRGGLPEIIEDSVTGFLVEAGDPVALAARLDELLADDALRRRMGIAARQRAETHFNRERFVGEFIRLLERPARNG